jgi:hypothetical protein
MGSVEYDVHVLHVVRAMHGKCAELVYARDEMGEHFRGYI